MTKTEAETKAKEVFGEDGYVYDLDERVGIGKYNRIPRFYVGSGPAHYGNGKTWEDAFKNVRRTRKEKDAI
jgi:hypothetical protein